MRNIPLMASCLISPSIITLITAVQFSSWYDTDCRGPMTLQDQPLEPYECYNIIPNNLDLPHESIQLSGLQDTNNPGGDYLDLYTEKDCQVLKSRVKWSGYCHITAFRSVKYFPPTDVNATELHVNISPEDQTRAERQREADEHLERVLLETELAYERTGSVQAARDAAAMVPKPKDWR